MEEVKKLLIESHNLIYLSLISSLGYGSNYGGLGGYGAGYGGQGGYGSNYGNYGSGYGGFRPSMYLSTC